MVLERGAGRAAKASRGRMAKPPVVALDGPVGTGKGTLGIRLASWLGWHYLDSGVLYRLTALLAQRRGIGLDDEQALARLAERSRFRQRLRDGAVQALLAGEDVGALLRGEDCARQASRVAAHPAVRRALLARQLRLRRRPGLVADGRDMGTVVFPDAPLKFFLTASAGERARRRGKQLKSMGMNVSLRHLTAEIARRDERDSRRTVAPLRPADDAVVVDTTGLDEDAVFKRCAGLAAERFGRPRLP